MSENRRGDFLTHTVGYLGDGFTGQKTQPTVFKVLKEKTLRPAMSTFYRPTLLKGTATVLSLTMRVYRHWCSRWSCLPNGWNFKKIRTCQFQVIDLWANWKRIIGLLVINSNFGLFRTVFEILTRKAKKYLVFLTPPLFDAPLRLNFAAKPRQMGFLFGTLHNIAWS